MNPHQRLRSCVMHAGGLLLMLAGAALTAGPQQTGDPWSVSPVVTVAGLPDESTLVTGSIRLPAPLATVFAVLTDYDHVADFIDGMDTCELLETTGNVKKVRQSASRNLLLFQKQVTLTLTIQEFFPDSIVYTLEEGPFHVYRGAWTLQADSGRNSTFLSSATITRPAFFAPRFLYRNLAQSDFETVLENIRDEVYRRLSHQGDFD